MKKDRTKDALRSLKKIYNFPVAKFLLKFLSKKKRIERALDIYCGLDSPRNIREVFMLKFVSFMINRGAKTFGGKKEEFLDYFKEKAPRRGLSLVLRSIAEYGITKPQKLIAPFLVVWDYTNRCNLNCKHCYANANERIKDELNTEQRKYIINKLADAGVVAIAFSGGEPLVCKDFFEIANYAHKKGIYVSVATNGTLITKNVAELLKNNGVDYIEISLDHSNPKMHDEFRGIKGVWKKTIDGIKNCVSVGLYTCIAVTVTKFNYNDVPNILKLASKLKVRRVIAFNFIPTGKGKDIKETDITPQQREKLLNFLYNRLEKSDLQIFSTCPAYARISLEHVEKKHGSHVAPTHFAGVELTGDALMLADFIGGCGAGRNYCAIEHNGDIYPCVFMPIKLGNILKNDFVSIWKNNNILNMLRNREKLKGDCGKCKYKYVCGGCRARAYAIEGDILASDRGCILVKNVK